MQLQIQHKTVDLPNNMYNNDNKCQNEKDCLALELHLSVNTVALFIS